MEQTEKMVMMLNQMPSPAFFVKDGIIVHANSAAIGHMITVGSKIREMLVTGVQEYADFRDGCLYLTINICGIPCDASVTRMHDFDYFVLEQEDDQTELQAMALAAQELRSPLANVMTVADRLFPLTSFDDDPAAQAQLARINRGLFQMLRIISNMSDAYRYSQDRSPRLETRDICGILEELFRGSEALIQHTGTSLRFTNLSERVYCLVDAEKLERAVHNMLSNALKFTPKGGTIDAKLARRGKMLYLTIQDSGSGIPGGLQTNVYKHFQRKPGIEDSRFGIGLGMVLIRSAAAAHGGTVLMEQSADRGTRITMSIAIRQSTDSMVRSAIISVDYAGERDHRLIELSESLPYSLYQKEKIN